MDPKLQAWLLAQDNLMWETSHRMGGKKKVEVRMCDDGDLLGTGNTVLNALTSAMTKDEADR